jgi:hypothetical protein
MCEIFEKRDSRFGSRCNQQSLHITLLQPIMNLIPLLISQIQYQSQAHLLFQTTLYLPLYITYPSNYLFPCSLPAFLQSTTKKDQVHSHLQSTKQLTLASPLTFTELITKKKITTFP